MLGQAKQGSLWTEPDGLTEAYTPADNSDIWPDIPAQTPGHSVYF